MTLLVALLLALAAAPTPQTQAPQGGTSPPDPVVGVQPTIQIGPPPPTYLIGPQDLLRITVFDEPELNVNNQHRVETDGTITYPLIGRVSAACLTLLQFQNKLAAQLVADGYLKNPQIRVEVDQYKSQSIFVLGEVRSPNKIAMPGPISLLEALALVGSVTSQASTEVTITRQKTPQNAACLQTPGKEPEGEQLVVDIRDTLAAQAFMLRENDVVTVAKAQTIFVNGHVRNQGQIIWQRGMTLATAVTIAGGLSERGTYRGAYATRTVNGKPTEVKLEEQDKILPDDVITINPRRF